LCPVFLAVRPGEGKKESARKAIKPEGDKKGVAEATPEYSAM
jgi:hypothetical protein